MPDDIRTVPSAAIEIYSSNDYPAGALSNFTPHDFKFDGEMCASMEGLLQSLKFEDIAAAATVRTLTRFRAKSAGFERNEIWKAAGMVWWKGRAIDRLGDAYQRLLDDAYRALFTQNADALAALLATGDAPLIHPSGSDDPSDTILTAREFCQRLEALRAELTRAEPSQPD